MTVDSQLLDRLMHAPTNPGPAARVAAYLTDVVGLCAASGGSLVSLVLFGSVATGGFTTTVSDVDLLLVIGDGADAAQRRSISYAVTRLEKQHGLERLRPRRARPLAAALGAFADRVTANERAFFVCTRAELLSGDPARILGLPPAQAFFVDRVAIPSIVASGVTVWGEDLLAHVPLPPIRRMDVAKAFFALFNQVLFTAAVYPILPGATRYAMDALKRSVHSCYFCYHARSAPLETEVAFFEGRYGPGPALTRLLALRREYRPSFGFVLSCLPALARLHLRTARDVRFPRTSRVGAEPAITGTCAID